MLNEFKKSIQVQPNKSSKEAEDIGVYENFDEIIQHGVKNNEKVIGTKNINPEFNENR